MTLKFNTNSIRKTNKRFFFVFFVLVVYVPTSARKWRIVCPKIQRITFNCWRRLFKQQLFLTYTENFWLNTIRDVSRRRCMSVVQLFCNDNICLLSFIFNCLILLETMIKFDFSYNWFLFLQVSSYSFRITLREKSVEFCY